MFFIKKQFKDIVSWGIVFFCFFAGFGLLIYSFFIIYPLDQILETEDKEIDLNVGVDVNVITKSLNDVKIDVFTESEAREIEIKKQEEEKKIEQEKAKALEIKKQKERLERDKKTKSEIGIASWYCPRWCAKLAAAHPKYPRGTKLKVTNLENKRSVIVVVNDFGPNRSMHPERIIDLTKTAFQKIANIQKGSIKVKVEKIIK